MRSQGTGNAVDTQQDVKEPTGSPPPEQELRPAAVAVRCVVAEEGHRVVRDGRWCLVEEMCNGISRDDSPFRVWHVFVFGSEPVIVQQLAALRVLQE